jgi:hypothetical protein
MNMKYLRELTPEYIQIATSQLEENATQKWSKQENHNSRCGTGTGMNAGGT